MTSHADAATLLLLRLRRHQTLAPDAEAAILELPFETETVPAQRHIVREGEHISRCCLLLEGYACRHKLSHRGLRQIVSFHLRGDVLDLQHLPFQRADHNIQAMTPATIAWVPKRAIEQLASDHAAIGGALWREALVEASIFREWVLNVGRRDARAKIAHMLCEFAVRGQTAGIGGADHLELPMTQTDIADATGLTSVHVNRMLRRLKDEGVVVQDRKTLRVNDWARLKAIAGFDAGYMHGIERAA